MALTTIIFGDAADGQLFNSSLVYATARNTTPASSIDTAGTVWSVGQLLAGSTYYCYLTYQGFDTSVIADVASIISVTLDQWLTTDTSTTDFIVQAREHDWGATLTTDDWVVGADLASKSLLATLATSGIGATGAYKTFVENGTNFRSAINKTGFTRFILVSDHQTDNIPQTTNEYVTFSSTDQAGTTQDPKLTIVDNSPGWDFIAVSTAVETTVAGGNLTLTEPTGAAEGDLLVACIAYRSNAAFTLPANWNLVATQQSSGDIDATNGIASGVMAWIVRGSSAPSYVFTRTAGDVARGTVVCYRDNHATPYDTGTANTLAVASATVTTGTFNTAEAGELIVAMMAGGDAYTCSAFDATDPSTASGATDTTTEPTAGTWIERHDSSTGTGADTSIAIADAIRATAGATGTIQATASGAGRSVMIAGAFKIRQLAVAASLIFNPFPMQPYLVR